MSERLLHRGTSLEYECVSMQGMWGLFAYENKVKDNHLNEQAIPLYGTPYGGEK